jgi:phage tail-like protein
MRLTPDAGTRVMQGSAQWGRCFPSDTAVVGELVMLATLDPVSPPPNASGNFTGGFAGLAFDPHCRLFHARPEDGAVEYVLWGHTTALGVHDDAPHPFTITAAGTEVGGAPSGPVPKRPLALACDSRDFLYVADPDDKAVWLIDTWQQEVARRLPFDQQPLDLAGDGDAIFVLLADGSTWQLAPCEAPQRTAWPAIPGAQRLAVDLSMKGGPAAWVVVDAGLFDATLHAVHLGQTMAVPFCTDLVIEPPSAPDALRVLVLAQRPGEEFLRLQMKGITPTRLAGLIAPHYDGRGIALAPDGRIAFWTAQGLRHAAPARARYRQSGLVYGFALDSDHEQTGWGRLVVEACVPQGTRIRFWAFTRDDLDYPDPMGGPAADGGPPRLSQHMWDLESDEPQILYRDPSQRPLAPAAADGFALYDAPVMAPPGRYLWLVFSLEGTRSKSPSLRSARVAYPGHGLLGQLPRTFWREREPRDFLFRLLSPIAAMLDEWEAVSGSRQRLLDARIAPPAALAWLAGFVGLVLEPCWPADVQRRMILEAAALFRTRGTLASLQRMVEILTDSEVVVIEHFRLRGGGVAGNAASVASQAVLGAGYRVGGMIGEPGSAPIAGAQAVDFDDFAHRFTVIVVAALDDAQLTCVRRLIEYHKPAHTDFALCTASAGLRAGVGAHIGISSVIGKSSGFATAVVGDAALGAGYLLGRPALEGEQA